ncbi:MAG: AMP-binding protein, partial [Actinomycetota bacterium]
MNYQNIYSLFREQAAKYRGKAIFYEPSGEGWVVMNWENFEQQVHDFACALLAKGLTRSASVAILAGNVPEWTIVDAATIAAGGVGVGIYPTNSPEQCAYIINHSDAEFVFVDTEVQLKKVLSIQNQIKKVKQIIFLDLAAGLKKAFEISINSANIIPFTDFIAFGKQNTEKFRPRVEEIGFNAKPDETAIMVYTSGTTGQPKGAMLSHQYILNSVESLRQSVPIFHDDVSFSYLPGCHVAERISGIYNRLYNG